MESSQPLLLIEWRFKSETGSLSGTVEVTYVSLKSVYSIQDRWALGHIIVNCIMIMIKTFNHQNPCKKSNPCPQLQVPTCAFNNQLPLWLSRWRQPVRQVFIILPVHFLIITINSQCIRFPFHLMIITIWLTNMIIVLLLVLLLWYDQDQYTSFQHNRSLWQRNKLCKLL